MSDFNHDWLDKPYNELTDEQLKAVADWHQDWSNKDQHRACVHMMALRTQIAAERERADRAEADAEMGRRWRADSSLETWFPYTAEELARTKVELAGARLQVAAQHDAMRTEWKDLLARAEKAEAEVERLKERDAEWERKASSWMASPEAAQRLDGYRELAQRLNTAEAERDALRADAERLNRLISQETNMTEAALKKMVDAFLTWTLPDDVCVDAIACQAGHPHRTGTTLLTAAQARAMFQHVLEAVEMRPTYVAPDAAIEFDAAIDAARGES